MTRQSAQITVGCNPFAVTEQLVRRNRRTRKFRMRGKKKRRSALRLPRVPMSRQQRPKCRPARPGWRRIPGSRKQAAAETVTSAAPLIQGRSGWRRMVPVAVQGASSSTVAQPLSRRATSALDDLGREFYAGEVFVDAGGARRIVLHRCHLGAGAASCVVLPPGAAQRSSTRSPAPSPSSRVGRVAAASCTQQLPSVKPGRSSILPWQLRRRT